MQLLRRRFIRMSLDAKSLLDREHFEQEGEIPITSLKSLNNSAADQTLVCFQMI
jgi:hypothetical protein